MKTKTPSCHTLEFRSLVVLTIVCLAMNRGLLKAQPSNVLYTFTTLAGPSGSGVQFDVPFGVAVDSSTNIYMSDVYNQVIRKIAPNGAVTTVAGLSGTSGSADGSGTDARFYDPHAVALDGSGNLYVADTGNNTIRQITPAGLVTTLAGQPGVSGNADGTGSSARFSGPEWLAVDGAGNVYVSDTGNGSLRKITPPGVVTTLATALYSQGVALDASGNIYLTGLNLIRKLSPGGAVTVLAGSSYGSSDGTGSAAQFNYPAGIVLGAAGNLYVTDGNNNTIRKITPEGVVTTFAGLAGTVGSEDGNGNSARFSGPRGIAVDTSGRLYIADAFNNEIRGVSLSADVSTVAGSGGAGSTDGTGTAARFQGPQGVAVDGSGTVYVSDTGNNTIRKITPGGVVSTLAGLAGTSGSADGVGSTARFDLLAGLTVDSSGIIYAADSRNHTIRKITSGDMVSTWVGLAGSPGSADGSGNAARFNYPSGIKVDSSGFAYVADGFNHTIRKISPVGLVSTLAGLAGATGTVDGTGSAARFNNPRGIVLDASGNIYVADALGHTIRKVTPGGEVSTLAGLGGSSGSADGIGSAARFNVPFGVLLDPAKNLVISDSHNHTIRRIMPSGLVTTIAGMPGISGDQDGTGTTARFNDPHEMDVDSFGIIYIADTQNNSIRKGVPGFICPANISVTAPAGQNTIPVTYSAPTAIPGMTVTCTPPSGADFSEGTTIVTCTAVSQTNSVTCTFTVTVIVPPTITIQPESIDVTAGQTLGLSVLASGSSPLFYAWLFEGVTIPGATNSSLVISNAQSVNEGVYQTMITNNGGSVESTFARVRVVPPSPPSIATDPSSVIVPAGRDAVFTVTVRGSPPLIFQWFKDGSPLSGATSAQLIITNAQIPNEGKYWVVVTNALGKATSAPATLKVSDGPPFFVVQPSSITVTNGANVTLTALARGSDPLTYQWRRDSSILFGAHNSSLSFSNISVSAAGFYDVVVSNTVGTVTSSVAQVIVYQAPLLQQGLSNQIVDAKSTVLLAVAAAGAPAVTYGWQLNAISLPGATNSTLLLSNVQPAQSGYYSVRIANLLGSVSSTGRVSVFGPSSSLVSWGDDSGGQIDVPANLHNVVAVAGGDFHTVALRHNGTLAAWGYNGDGQVSLPTNTTRFVSIASGSAHNLAITETGSAIAWGRNDSGQLNVPANAALVLAVAAGDAHSLALLPSGTVLAWGNNSFGQATVPPELTGVSAVVAGRNHNLALRTNGTVAAWGLNNSGQASPPPSLSGVTAVAAGYLHSAALLSNGTVVAWGDNTFGQTNKPAGLSNVIAIAAGDFHTLALKADGAVVAWGDDTYGQIEVPPLSTHLVGVASGYYHSMALVRVPFLHCHQIASGLLLQWDEPAVLQWSATVYGPYSDIPNVSGSYTNTDFSVPAKFFRLRW